jgi:trans-aconitate 2-methyltransferase
VSAKLRANRFSRSSTPIIREQDDVRVPFAFTVCVTDWSGRDYAEVSSLQRAMITDAMTGLTFARDDWVLDIGCGDGFLTRAIADLVPDGYAVGADASHRMITTARSAAVTASSGPRFVVADARRLPFTESFDAVVSFNALHWVPQQTEALRQIAATLRPGGRATVQMVCGGPRASLESVVMDVCQSASWATYFAGFTAPFVHVTPDSYGELATSTGLALDKLTVTDREWDFGSREAFQRWCGVGSTVWTDRLPESDRDRFITEAVDAYEPIAGRPGLFRFTQMRAELRR